jgi:ATP-binding cassette, subfamily B, bacterial
LRRLVAERVGLLRLLRAVPLPALVGLASMMVLSSLLPAATAIAVGWLIARAVEAAGAGTSLGVLALPLAVVGALLTLDQVAQSMLVPFRNWVATRVNGAVRVKVRRAVSARPGIDHLESQAIRDAATLPVDNAYLFNLGAGAEGQLWLMTRFVGAFAATAVVASRSLLAAAAAIVFVAWQRALLRRHYASSIATAMTGTTGDGRASSYWSDVVGTPLGAKEVRLFGFSQWAIDRFYEHGAIPVRELSRVLLSAWNLHGWVFALNALAGLIPFLLLARMAVDGRLSAPELAVGLGGVVAIGRVLGAMGWEAFSIEASVPQLAALRELDRFQEEAAAGTASGQGLASDQVPTITFDDVSFAYPGSDRCVLEHLDLELRPGESVAIVGENGAGKTTLLKLLAGFYLPSSGRILVDGADLRTLDPVEWRRRLSVIFQDFVRFELTAFENVALADLDHPKARSHAEAAAGAAGAEDLIAQLLLGWETILSRGFTGGAELSGGQWQRIALARALYGARVGARVLILDEPTASLDVAAEVALFDQLLTHAGGCTAIVVSHRFSTVRRASRIIVLADGRVAEDGDHATLYARKGAYAELYDLQAKRFREEVAT